LADSPGTIGSFELSRLPPGLVCGERIAVQVRQVHRERALGRVVLLHEFGTEDLSVAHCLRLGGEHRGGAVAERVDLDDAPAVPVLVGSENSLTALLTSDLLLQI